jgi:nitroreductase
MDTRQAIRTVRVVRKFRPEPLPADTITAILDAGRHAGSSKNLQRWQFIVVTDPPTLERLGAVGPWAGHLRRAPAAIALVTPDPYAPDAALSILWDLGRAAQNMVLAAWEMGVGGCPATVYGHDLCREILGYPADHHCEYVLGLGHPADPTDLTRPPRAGGRVELASIVHRERWAS